MKLELERRLVSAYPGLYRDVDKSPLESLMCFGFECQDGWIEIEACSYREARLKTLETLGEKWASIYSETEFNRKYFPAGKYGDTLGCHRRIGK